MDLYMKPVRKMLMIGCSLFSVAVCATLVFVSYLQFSKSMYAKYETDLTDVLNYVELKLDADDLQKCINTGKPTPQYLKSQAFLNEFIDPMQLLSLYVVIPSKENMTNVISATTAAARASGEPDLQLGESSGAWTLNQRMMFLACWDAEDIQFFRELSPYDDAYTGCKPLRNSAGETVALLCADTSTAQLHRSVYLNMIYCALPVAAIGLVAGIVLLLWMRLTIMNAYGRIEYAEARAQSAELEAESMTRIAYRDPLTHVKSKAAYDQAVEELSGQIAAGGATFAIVLIDLNDLKHINDTYGHENGDKFIIGSCRQICHIYAHSPVFRVGGDEFAVVLQGEDYEKRDALLDEVKHQFRISRKDEHAHPWERYDAAAGMAQFEGEAGETVEEVFRNADDRMYRAKQQMKHGVEDGTGEFEAWSL